MSDKYVWLLKQDIVYKDYQEKGWHTILSVRTFSNDVYYCYSSNKHFVSEVEKNKLLTPICVINKEYKDCMIIFEEDENYGFIWNGKRCFGLERSFIDEFIDSKMKFSKRNEIVKINSASQTVIDTEIQVRSSMGLYYIMAISASLVVGLFIGVYLWLF